MAQRGSASLSPQGSFSGLWPVKQQVHGFPCILAVLPYDSYADIIEQKFLFVKGVGRFFVCTEAGDKMMLGELMAVK
jgi:hypothetical protein